MDKVAALLPMKGHSERIPNKNLKIFNGKPLYHFILTELLDCSSIESIYVDTDSDDIINDLNINFQDVSIINRPRSIQGDLVSMNDIIEYDLTRIKERYFIQTHSTNPLLKASTIENAIKFFFSNIDQYDSIFSVTEWKTRLYWKDGEPVNHDPKELIRTQDLPPVYEENSNFYIFSRDSFSAKRKRIGLIPYMYPINKLEALDIDEPEDFILAQILQKDLTINV